MRYPGVLISAPSNTDRVLVPDQHGWEIGDATTESTRGCFRRFSRRPPPPAP